MSAKALQIKKFFTWPNGLTALVVGGLAFFAGDYKSFTDGSNTIFERQMAEVEAHIQNLEEPLRLLSQQANGGPKVSDKVVSELSSMLTRLQLSAYEVKILDPAIEPEFDAWAETMNNLQDSAKIMSGPLDAKPFVAAVDAFFEAQQNFFGKVSTVRRDYSWFG